jgi:hypothetical protein
MDTEQQFDNEFDIVAVTKEMVEKIKSDVKLKYGNKKRHRQ